MSKDDKLSLIQREFVRQYLLHRNGTKAAIEAGYAESGAGVQASRLLKNANILAAIKKGEERVQKKFELKQEDLINQLYRMAFFDPMSVLEFDKKGRLVFKKDIPKEYLSGSSFTIYPEYQNKQDQKDGVIRAKLTIMSSDRRGAIELLGKQMNMWKGPDGSGSGAGEESRNDVLKRVHELFRKHRERGGSGDGSNS